MINVMKGIKRKLQARAQVRAAVRQYGMDEVLEALRHTYEQYVFKAAKSSEPVQERMIVLDQAQAGLKKVQREQTLSIRSTT